VRDPSREAGAPCHSAQGRPGGWSAAAHMCGLTSRYCPASVRGGAKSWATRHSDGRTLVSTYRLCETVPIPALDVTTGYLPAGTHAATMEEVRERFAKGPKRKKIFRGLEIVVERLASCGVTQIWVDGSFVTSKIRPSDVDIIIEKRSPDVNMAQLDSFRLLDRAHVKRSKMVDLLVMPGREVDSKGNPTTIKEFFETDRQGRPKGILQLVLDKQAEDTQEGDDAQE
jgi:hypothetical protein